MIHVGVTAPGVKEAVSNRECNEPRVVSKILIRQESSPDTDASTDVGRVYVASFVKLRACVNDRVAAALFRGSDIVSSRASIREIRLEICERQR